FPRPSAIKFCVCFYALVFAGVVVHYYPYRVDPPEVIHFEPTPAQQDFYNVAFDQNQLRYQQTARRPADFYHVREKLADFIGQNHLSGAHVLEVGSGEGTLQDMVEDYTGLDISATARRNYHKRFVQADARAMPFKDGEFDAIWSIWVLEHVPNPEQALREMRRVLKPNGLLYLDPAWLCPDFAADGYPVRPFSDFGLRGKVIKASLPIQQSRLFEAAYELPIRSARLAAWNVKRGPTAFHYRPIVPNYRE